MNQRERLYVPIFAAARANNSQAIEAIRTQFDQADVDYASDLTRREVELESEAFRVALGTFAELDKEFRFRLLSAIKRDTLPHLAERRELGCSKRCPVPW